MRKFVVLVSLAALLAGCRGTPPAPERDGDGVVGRIEGTLYNVYRSDNPLPSEPSFFNELLGSYEVVREMNDEAVVMFFESQDDADAYVLARFRAGRRPNVRLIESWPPPVGSGLDYDLFVSRDIAEILDSEVSELLNGTLRSGDWNTRHPAFRHELSGRETEYVVYVRDGFVADRRRLEVRSANVQFHSVWWPERE
jgi:hypothetical protein